MPKQKIEEEAKPGIQDVVAGLKAKFGKDTVCSALSEADIEVKFWPTGYLSLDWLIGTKARMGGIPQGRIIQFLGEQGNGKSTLAYLYIAAVQRAGGLCAYVDLERAIHPPEHLRRFGVDFENLIYTKPDSGEKAFGIVEEMAKSGVSLIVLDSLAAVATESMLDGEVEDKHVAAQANLINRALLRLVPVCDKYGCTLVMVNQLRCIERDSLVTEKNRGIIRIEELVPGDKILGESGYVTVKGVEKTGKMIGRVLKTQCGSQFKLSLNHRQPVLREGEMVEVLGEEVKVGDWLLSPRTSSSAPENKRANSALFQGKNLGREASLFLCEGRGVSTEIVDRYFFTQIVEIEEGREMEMVDIEVDGGLFIADGFLTHNSNLQADGFSKFQTFFQKNTSPGGKAPGFYSSVIIEVSSGKNLKDGEGESASKVGKVITLRLQKTKVSEPFRQVTVDLHFDRGIDRESDIFAWAEAREVVRKSGNTYYFGERKLGVGRDNAADALRADQELSGEVEARVRDAIEGAKA